MKLSFALLLPVALLAQHAQTDEAAALFVKLCSACHGDSGKGGRGSDLTTGQWLHGNSDEDLRRVINKGIPGTQMPGFPTSEADTNLLIAHLRKISGGIQKEVAGDPELGRAAFFDEAQCSNCHMYGGRGGLRAPDLTRIAKSTTIANLRSSITDPDADISIGYNSIEATTKSGKLIRGVARHEDTFNIQILDNAEHLYSFRKSDLSNLKHIATSQMPKQNLPAQTVDNILAFLTRYDAAKIELPAWRPPSDFNVTFDRLKNSAAEPQNWLTHWGDFAGTHSSPLKSITPQNAANLRPQWNYQFGAGLNETTPLVVDGIMFVTGPQNNATALDARSGNPIWQYKRPLPKIASHCTVMTNRGFAILGDRLYMATLDAHLVALNAKTGNVIFDVEVDDYQKGFSITHAPLAIDGKIIVGITAGECALTGYVDAYDAATGKRLWRTQTVAQPGDPNRATWAGDSAKYGGAPTWMTGTYDPATDTIYWATGNPGPDYNGAHRAGDNLYSDSVLALDPHTGKMKWYFQFTPHDTHDWDATQTLVLIDGVVRGKPRKLLVTAQRNAFYYVLDRTTGEFLNGQAFAKQNWAKGLDDKGRPIVLPNTDPTSAGVYTCPDALGSTNWGAPSYDNATKLFYVSVKETCATYTSVDKSPVPGEGFTGGADKIDPKIGEPGFIRALDATTGKFRWDFPIKTGAPSTGNLATAGGVLFASSADGNLIALDSKTGKYLWHYQTGAKIITSPMAYAVDGKQYIAIAAQSMLITFALP
ncbi:PQQ-dependent dehydrogenase, methanol/ethanol family [Bryobacter aggregatus]|uniref:PQQ-dependent dehydrogenase, methanol/ethanol family n=1 Tax=Bryobacter aggregatus TaxID=360054 RepID=UPI00068EC542|nr:PQQ-dependent dehydrogenase, methanol/ethanol family [Bryobacter aggregatus]